MDTATKKALENIAKEESESVWIRNGLTPLHEYDGDPDEQEDEEDFVSVSVRDLARMLERAYEMGRSSK